MGDKEKNYISAVVYIGDEKEQAKPFLQELTARLASRFEFYELVLVDDCSSDGTVEEVRQFLNEMQNLPPVTMIHMSLRQSRELAMNAGLDMAVGDFVYEFDSMSMPYPADMIDKVYDACLAGSDIVSASPANNRGIVSALFYRLFNSASKSKYNLHTDAFRLLSRRAINRVHSISPTMPYRKAAYAASGLKMETIMFEGRAGKTKEYMRGTYALDSLALYTDVGYKASLGISGVMLLLMLASLVYTLVVYLGGKNPVPGWTTTMLLLTGGFFGIFLILSIVLKYLTLLTELVFKKQKYLVESVEKIA